MLWAFTGIRGKIVFFNVFFTVALKKTFTPKVADNGSTSHFYHLNKIFQERLKIAREFVDRSAERRAHSNLGNANIFLGEFEKAAEHYKQTLLLAQVDRLHTVVLSVRTLFYRIIIVCPLTFFSYC